MNALEMGELLGDCALYDNRTAGEADILAWMRAIGDLNYDDAADAVAAHYAESTDRIMPGHIRVRVMEQRARRLKRIEMPPPPAELIDDPDGYRAALHAAAVAIGDGRDPERAMNAVTATRRRELGAGDGRAGA